MAGTVREMQFDGLPALTLESEAIRLVVLPTVGGKMISLVDRSTDREWLWRSPTRRLQPPTYASNFADWDISGFDECFPGIGEGPYPEFPWAGVEVPDHGEWWTLPWDARVEGGEVVLSLRGVRFAYEAEKRLSFVAPNRVRMRYRVQNLAPMPFKYFWSAHPLFAPTPTTRIRLPDGARVRVDSSMGGRLGSRFDEVGWPIARDRRDGASIDLTRLTPGLGTGDKLYAHPLPAGWCALHDEAAGDYVGFGFDRSVIPYVGVWINQDAWPGGDETCFNVALEPCSGYPDPLHLAVAGGECQVLPPRGITTWEMILAVGRAKQFAGLAPDGIVLS
jgi:hypothetical protein